MGDGCNEEMRMESSGEETATLRRREQGGGDGGEDGGMVQRCAGEGEREHGGEFGLNCECRRPGRCIKINAIQCSAFKFKILLI